MTETKPGRTAPSEYEGDMHDCCCWHVVNVLEARPGPAEERLAMALDKLADCPHTHDRTNLELYVELLKDGRA